MLEERDELKDELLAHSTENKAQKAKVEENMVTLRAEKDCAEKHVRHVEKREESLLKERDDLLGNSTEERAQKEEEIVKLNEKLIKLEENVAILLASEEHGETELTRVEKAMLEEREELLSHFTENKAQKKKLEEIMIILKADNDFTEKHVRDFEKIEESLLKERDDLLECSTE